jgi:hypothetical protein
MRYVGHTNFCQKRKYQLGDLGVGKNIKMGLKMGCEDVGWIYLAQDRSSGGLL